MAGWVYIVYRFVCLFEGYVLRVIFFRVAKETTAQRPLTKSEYLFPLNNSPITLRFARQTLHCKDLCSERERAEKGINYQFVTSPLMCESS